MLQKFIKATEWTIKNLAKMTEDDWRAFLVVQDQFDAWAETLPEQTRAATATQIKMVIHALKTFEGSKFRGIW